MARRARLTNQDPTVLLKRMPRVWANFTLGDIAEAVRKEYPGEYLYKYLNVFLHFQTKSNHEFVN